MSLQNSQFSSVERQNEPADKPVFNDIENMTLIDFLDLCGLVPVLRRSLES